MTANKMISILYGKTEYVAKLHTSDDGGEFFEVVGTVRFDTNFNWHVHTNGPLVAISDNRGIEKWFVCVPRFGAGEYKVVATMSTREGAEELIGLLAKSEGAST